MSTETELLVFLRVPALFGSFSGSGAGSTPLKPTLTALPSLTGLPRSHDPVPSTISPLTKKGAKLHGKEKSTFP